MKKFAMALVIAQAGFTTVAHAAQEVEPISLEEVCQMLAQSQLPASCSAVCADPKSYGQSYVLKLTNGKGETSLPSSEHDLAKRTLISSDVLAIEFGTQGSNASLKVIVDRADKVKFVSVNDIECKE